MGRVSKGSTCSVSGCGQRGFRSIPSSQLARYMSITTSERRAVLCESHYKQFKKLSKRDREMERARYGV